MIQTFNTTLVKKQELIHDIFLLRFQLDPSQQIEFKAGQYMILFVPQEGKMAARRLYSIISKDSEKTFFDLLVEFIPNGVGSQYLKKMNIGDKAEFQGPAGVFILHENNKNKIFLATGTGIAPMIPMLHKLFSQPESSTQELHLYWGMPTCDDAYLLEEFEIMQKEHKNFHFHLSVSRESSLERVPTAHRERAILGRITHGVDHFISSKNLTIEQINTGYEFYICGGKDVVESVKQFLLDKGIEKASVHFEKFV